LGGSCSSTVANPATGDNSPPPYTLRSTSQAHLFLYSPLRFHRRPRRINLVPEPSTGASPSMAGPQDDPPLTDSQKLSLRRSIAFRGRWPRSPRAWTPMTAASLRRRSTKPARIQRVLSPSGPTTYVARIRGYGYRYAIRGYSDTPFFQKQGYGDTPIYIKNKNK